MQVTSTQPLPQSVLDAINTATQNTSYNPNAATTTGGTSSATSAATIDQNEFMTLMLAQLKNQDPTQPVDSTAFLGQLAQISQVQGLSQLNSSFSTLSASLTSNQALQASSLLGRNALVASGTVNLASSGQVTGAVDLPQASGNVVVNVTDSSGTLVQQISLGAQPTGLANFTWNGNGANGARAPAGTYNISAVYQGANNQATSASTLVNASVQSVTMGAGSSGLTLTLSGVGNVAFSAVRRIS